MVSDEYAKARKGLIKAEQTDYLQSSSAEGTSSGKKEKRSRPKSYASALQKLKRTPRPLGRESSSDSISFLESQSEFTVPLAHIWSKFSSKLSLIQERKELILTTLLIF